MQPIVFVSAVSRLFPGQSHSMLAYACTGSAFDSARIEQQLRSDKLHERGRALGTIRASLTTADTSEIVRLIAISLENTNDHRLIKRSISTIDKLVDAKILSPYYEADPHSPIDRAIMKFRGWWRGVQMRRIKLTLKNNADLRNSLVGLIQHEDSEIRRRVVSSLFLANSPSQDFERFMQQHYQVEGDPGVRVNIINGLTMHKYTSDATISIYRQALNDPWTEARKAALRAIDALGERVPPV